MRQLGVQARGSPAWQVEVGTGRTVWILDGTHEKHSGLQSVKNLPEMQETWVQSLGQEDPLEKGMATQYSCLENSMSIEAWWVIVHGISNSWTGLSD